MPKSYQKSYQVVFETDDGGEHLICTKETRNNIGGWRVSRYTKSLLVFDFVWDEQYLFYQTLEEVAAAFEAGNYEAGRKAF